MSVLRKDQVPILTLSMKRAFALWVARISLSHLAPVIETVSRLRRELPDETTLLGFCGAPWTIATYMIAGHGTPDQAPARLFGYRDHAVLKLLLDKIADYSIDYLVAQIDAGADAVQIFDSWAVFWARRNSKPMPWSPWRASSGV